MLVPLLFSGCALWASPATAPRGTSSATSADSAERSPAPLLPWPEEEEAGPVRRAPEPGDYYVYRFAGSFTDSLVVLTERVVTVRNGQLVVDFLLEKDDFREALRVRMDAETRAVLAAFRVEDGEETAVPISEYERFIARTQFAPDTNDGRLDSKASTCLIGTEEVDCQVTRYRVSMGDQRGVLSISNTGSVPTRDIGGVITAEDGRLVYSARLVERGHETRAEDAVAATLAADE